MSDYSGLEAWHDALWEQEVDRKHAIKRFALWIKIDEKGCWIWQGNISPLTKSSKSRGGGYGRKLILAHRLVYEAVFGPITQGLVLDHLCSQRACVNPEHLEAVTQKENVRRALGGLWPETECRKGHRTIHKTLKKDGYVRTRCSICDRDYQRRYRLQKQNKN